MKGPGVLLSAPMTSAERIEVKHSRPNNKDYKNKSDVFELNSDQRSYQRQFYHIYNARLAALKPRIERSAVAKFGKSILIKNLCDLDALAASEESSEGNNKEKEHQKVVIIGTLFKNQPLKPDILKDLSDEQGVTPQPSHTSYVSDADEMALEDNNARIRLIFDTDAVAKGCSVSSLPTGVVCGVYGREIRTGKGKGTTGGKFLVEDVIFADVTDQPKYPVIKEERLVAFISGLELSGNSCDVLSSLELAISWMVGDAGEMSDQGLSSTVERIIFAGNSLSEATRNKESMKKARYLTKDEDAASINAVNNLDDLLVSLCVSLDVDVMSGDFDPANQILPQQPLHHCLFPQASPYPTLQTVTNPYMFELAGRIILGTSGQNVDDILRNTSIAGSLDAMEAILRWSHIAPTSPDTLGCFPFQDKDPFVLTQRPHVLFAANQKNFEHKIVETSDGSKTLLLSIPKFSTDPRICLVNLSTLECRSIKFESHFDNAMEEEK